VKSSISQIKEMLWKKSTHKYLRLNEGYLIIPHIMAKKYNLTPKIYPIKADNKK